MAGLIMGAILLITSRDLETRSHDFNFAENSTDFFIKIIKRLNRKKNSSFIIFEDTVTKEVSLEF